MIGCDCDRCTSADPRDRRLRSSVYVEYDGISILVDAGPDFRYQCLRAGIRHIDAILLTHNHKDHTGGLDDVRSFNLLEHHPMNIYCEKYVEDSLKCDYPYAFTEVKYPGAPEFHVNRIDGAHSFTVRSNSVQDWLEWERGVGYVHYPPRDVRDVCVQIVPIQGWHHKVKKLSVLGYRFGDIAYLTDISMMDECEYDKLRGLKAVTLGCVKIQEHYSHPSLQECLDFFERVGAEDSYITHLSHLIPRHEEFAAMLPEHVHPAYDTLVIG